MTVSLPDNRPDADVQAAMNEVDEVIFFSRLGDQGRFHWYYTGPHCVMSYALNEGMLTGGYGTLDHAAMTRMKDAITLHADHILVTCPLGTPFEGRPGAPAANNADVIISRFPLGIPKPVPADGFHGRAVLSNYLTSTGSNIYTPDSLTLREPVTAHFEDSRITRFEGPASMVADVEAHYARVAAEFGLDAYNIDSWHAMPAFIR